MFDPDRRGTFPLEIKGDFMTISKFITSAVVASFVALPALSQAISPEDIVPYYLDEPEVYAGLENLIGDYEIDQLPDGENTDADSMCDRDEELRDREFVASFAGPWTVSNMTGFVYTPQTGLFPFPPSAPETYTFAMIGDELIATGVDNADAIRLYPYDRRNWVFGSGPSEAQLDGHPEPKTFDQISILAGCEINDLPRFFGFTNIDQQGVKMRFAFRFVVVTANHLYGIMTVDGAVDGRVVAPEQKRIGIVGMEAWRSIHLVRQQ